MGKMTRSLLCLLLIFSARCWAQNLHISYKLSYTPTVNDTMRVAEKHLLIINGDTNQSYFLSASSDSNFNIQIFKDTQKGILKKYETIQYQIFSDNTTFPAKWKLSSEFKTLLGYKCQKAEIEFGGRSWVAWYALDIPIPDGPYKFNGLPGLILQVASTDGEYSFNCEEIKKTNNRPIMVPKPVVEYGNQANEKVIKQRLIEDPASLYRSQMQSLKSSSMGMTVSYEGKEVSSIDMEKQIIEEFKTWQKIHTNPIEKGMLWVK